MPMPVVGFALALLVAVLGPATGSAAEVTLKVHHFLPGSSTTHAGFIEPWARKVERDSNGRIKIEIYPSMQLGGKPQQLFDQARDGVVDIVWTLPGYTPGRFPIMEAMELPFMVSSAEATSQAAWAFYEKYATGEFEDVKPLLLHTHGRGSFHIRNRAVKRLEDLEGLKVRAPSRVINAALESLGATPVGMPVPSVPQALSKGVIDAALLPYEVVLPLKVHEMVKHHTEITGPRGLYTAVFLFAMNKERYAALPADLRAVIDANTGLELAKKIGRLWDDAEIRGQATAVARGNHVSRISGDEILRWKNKSAVVAEDWVAAMERAGKDGRAMLAEARALVDHFENGH